LDSRLDLLECRNNSWRAVSSRPRTDFAIFLLLFSPSAGHAEQRKKEDMNEVQGRIGKRG